MRKAALAPATEKGTGVEETTAGSGVLRQCGPRPKTDALSARRGPPPSLSQPFPRLLICSLPGLAGQLPGLPSVCRPQHAELWPAASQCADQRGWDPKLALRLTTEVHGHSVHVQRGSWNAQVGRGISLFGQATSATPCSCGVERGQRAE